MLNSIYLTDANFEFDMQALAKYTAADHAGQKAALLASGKGNSCSAAYQKAFDAAYSA